MVKQETIRIVEHETIGNIDDVRKNYIKLFSMELPPFINSMVEAVEAWQRFDQEPDQDEKLAIIQGIGKSMLNGMSFRT